MTNSYDSQNTSSDSILGYLQEIVLIAVMLGERLPGTRRPIQIFPRGHRLREIPMKIVQSNLAQSLKLDELPRRLDVLALDELMTEEQLLLDEEVGFLAFRPAVWRDDRVQLSMVIGGMNREEGDWQCHEIGHINTEFRQSGGRWAAISEPHIYLAPEH
ncbi:MAG: hypothetical protein R3A46_12375 [Thermomicrobiales bacterium]